MKGAVPPQPMTASHRIGRVQPLDPMSGSAVVRDGPLTNFRDEGDGSARLGSIDCRTPGQGFRLLADSLFFAVLGALG